MANLLELIYLNYLELNLRLPMTHEGAESVREQNATTSLDCFDLVLVDTTPTCEASTAFSQIARPARGGEADIQAGCRCAVIRGLQRRIRARGQVKASQVSVKLDAPAKTKPQPTTSDTATSGKAELAFRCPLWRCSAITGRFNPCRVSCSKSPDVYGIVARARTSARLSY